MLKALGQVLFTGLQTPKHTTLESKSKDYELRKYESAKWVSTELKGLGAEAAMKEAFSKLFKYIQGDNDRKEKVDMTAPVTCLIKPGSTPESESSFTVSFFIPEQQQADPPKPTNPDIHIENRLEMTVYVRTYGGFSNDQIFSDELQKLVASLRSDGVGFQEAPYYRVGYDPPFKLTNRRNEVWILQ
ncbi:heme-binding protein 2-like [Engraulis encrasicolus]|uniref:heme-binding protein 2-like n=1 Tax=Engraulis encrasicolus TaxID=184585 RepID=UPI002FCFF304